MLFFFISLVLDLEAGHFPTSVESIECVNLCVPDSGRLLGEHGEFNREQFELMMRAEMLRYFRRQLKKAVLLSESQVHLNFLGTLHIKCHGK